MNPINRIQHVIAGLALLAIAAVAQANPEISVGAMYDTLDSGKNTSVKRIRNNGTSVAYVRVDIDELAQDGSKIPEPKDQEAQPGLIVSPSRLIIPPGGSQDVRLVMLGKREQERYFRTRYVPVPPTAEHGFSISSAEAEEYKNSLSAALSVQVGYGTLVTVMPSAPVYDTEVVTIAGQEFVHNRGNTTIFLEDVYTCQQRSPDKCEPPVRKRVAPGKKESLPSSATTYHKFKLVEGTNKRAITFGK
jgi:hypothetical protein